MNISPTGNDSRILQTGTTTGRKPGNFAALVRRYMQQTNHNAKTASKAGVELALGKSTHVSETLLAIQKADLSFQLMLGVRNKLVNAYKEIMRMQV